MSGDRKAARRRTRAHRARAQGEAEFVAAHLVRGRSAVVCGYEGPDRRTVLGVAIQRGNAWRWIEADDLPDGPHTVERVGLFLDGGGAPRKSVPKRWRDAMRALGIEA